jgi:Protein of unknown function (DUF4058)
MPLLDHFHPPLAPIRHWESFHARWATALADALNARLPESYFAEPQTQAGSRVEVDVAAFENPPATAPASSPQDGNVALLAAHVWAPPAPVLSMPGVCPESFEVLVFRNDGGARLVGGIELASPGNKDRQDQRRAFAIKCASYLYQGIGLVVIDIVTTRTAILHNEIVQVMENDSRFLLPTTPSLYAVAYRAVRRRQEDVIDLWPATLSLGEPLPTLPLFLDEGFCLPIDLEASYMEACHRLKLI